MKDEQQTIANLVGVLDYVSSKIAKLPHGVNLADLTELVEDIQLTVNAASVAAKSNYPNLPPPQH